MYDKKISIYKDEFYFDYNSPKASYKQSHQLTLAEIGGIIKKGGDEQHHIFTYKDRIAYIRRKTKAEAERTKGSLPSFTPSAHFLGEKKGINEPMKHSGFMVIDIDKLNNNQIRTIQNDVTDANIATMMFISPSGNGLKIILKVTGLHQQNHTRVFEALRYKFHTEFNIPLENLDKSGKDVSRLCYFSYDPHIYTNTSPVELRQSDLLVSYKQNKLAQKEGFELQDIDESRIDNTSATTIFYSVVEQLKSGADPLDYVEGQAYNWLVAITRLKKKQLTLSQVLPLVLEYVQTKEKPHTVDDITQKLTKLYKELYVGYDSRYTKQPAGTNTPTNIINQYLTEKLDYIEQKLRSEKTLYVNAPTGAGKTTMCYALVKRLGLQADFLMPTRALVQQQKDSTAATAAGVTLATIINDTPLSDVHTTVDMLVACYPAIQKLEPRKAQILIIDEAHSLVSDYGWKYDVSQLIDRLKARYEYVIYLSGSMFPLKGLYTDANYLEFTITNRFHYQYDLIQLGESVSDTEYYVNNLKDDCLNVFYLNNKRTLKNIAELLRSSGKKVFLLTKDEVDKNSQNEFTETYTKLINESELADVDVFLTTCYVQAGVNINNKNKAIHITFGRGSTLIDLIQFTARFRKMKPSISIIHSCQIGNTSFFNECFARERIQLLINIYKNIDKQQMFYNHTHDSENQERLKFHMTGVVRSDSGRYAVDEYYLAFEHYIHANRSSFQNKPLLERILALHHFTFNQQITYNTRFDEATNDEYVSIAKQNKQEIEEYKKQIISEMLSGEYKYRWNLQDTTRTTLEKKFEELSAYVNEKVIQDENLFKTSAFLNFKTRVAYIMQDKYTTSKLKMKPETVTQFNLFKQLKAHFTVGTTYQASYINAHVLSAGLGYSNHNFLKALEVMFHIKKERENITTTTTDGKEVTKKVTTGYTIVKEVELTDYTKIKGLDLVSLLNIIQL
ncbi:BT4734/BF3469 family protein [Hymenobacter sp. APR13]|uniref:BT4734/BF3469 family protein n=1 Tax=Hymenobacter sp. APR13 TaxID=1356852 RepID=UPI0004E05BAB|nr:BT4734/BF3469 family protein [Hymenobacter sp. APR13]AII50382.1 hypothetical protein N008_00080 [Hymenobacter sp. APR13]